MCGSVESVEKVWNISPRRCGIAKTRNDFTKNDHDQMTGDPYLGRY